MFTKTKPNRSATMAKTTKRYFWTILGRNQGQMVTEHQPQVAGEPEGDEGDAEGLRLITDSSDRTWDLIFKGKVIAQGKGAGPTVDEAMATKSFPTLEPL